MDRLVKKYGPEPKISDTSNGDTSNGDTSNGNTNNGDTIMTTEQSSATSRQRQMSNEDDDNALDQVLNPDPVRDTPRLSEPLSPTDKDYQRGTIEFLKTCGDTHYVVAVRRILGAPLRHVQYSLQLNKYPNLKLNCFLVQILHMMI